MKITVIGTALPPVMGGVEIHTYEFSRFLAKRGHRVVLLGYREVFGIKYPATEERDGIKIVRLNNSSQAAYIFNVFRYILTQARSKQVDIIHTQTVYPPGVSAWLLSLLYPVPYFVTSHGAEIMIYSKAFYRRFMRQALIRLAFKSSSYSFSASSELNDLSVAAGADPKKASYMSNCVDTEKFSPSPPPAGLKDKLGIPVKSRVILFLRRLVPKTGLQYIIETAPEVVKAVPEAVFLVVGDGHMRKEYEKKAAELGVLDSFRFAGSVANEEIPGYIAAADLAVFPSLAEATSIACLEIMSCGKPVIASNVGGLPEIIEDGKTGYLVDFGRQESDYEHRPLPKSALASLKDKMIQLSLNAGARAEIGANARKLVKENYSWDTYIDKVETLYRKALENHKEHYL